MNNIRETKFVALLIAVILAFLLASILLSGCKTVRAGTSHERDSVRVEHRVDTFERLIIDSVRIQMPCSDTIEVAYVERKRTEKVKQKTASVDTIYISNRDTIFQPYPVKEEVVIIKNSGFATFCIWYFWITFISFLIYLLLRYLKRRWVIM